MKERELLVPVCNMAGALAGNATLYTYLPFACELLEIISVASNATNATLEVGTASDADYYTASHTVGVSGTAVIRDAGDWNTATITTTYPHIAAGSTVKSTLDYDGNGGTAASDLQISFRVLVAE